VANLAAEGINASVHNVGDVMYDVALFYRKRARESSKVLSQLGLDPKGFALATCHRAENTDDPDRLRGILSGLAQVAGRMPVVFPLHPRTRKLVADHGLSEWLRDLTITDPLPFLDMVALEQAASLVLTDSGGVQKEAFFYEVPCITMRDETEWVETVESGWNCLVGADPDRITRAVDDALSGRVARHAVKPYGDGHAAEKIVSHLLG
jgi:UDP-GlcNAc3NAcA epimerase